MRHYLVRLCATEGCNVPLSGDSTTKSSVSRFPRMTKGTTLSSNVANHLHYDVTLHRIVTMIPLLGLKSRKSLLNLCQTAQDVYELPVLEQTLHEIRQDFMIRTLSGRPTLDELANFTSRLAERVIYRSFISMMVRSEALDKFAGAEEAIEEGFAKEYFAAQIERPREERISYQCMDPENYHPDAYSIYYQPTPWWLHKAKGFVHRFASRLEKLPILFPQVQRRKNMSQDTCKNLIEAGLETEDWRNLRTLDLELWKVKTGLEVQGDCEMRMTWGYNILKPRFYYATGGSNYWRSRHMKKIAQCAMEAVDSSKLARRQDPTAIQYSLPSEAWLSLWDLSSFTTQLSELKHFLYYLSKCLSEDLRVQQRPLQLLDYADGVITITADKYLMQYNEGENYNAPYSVWRVTQKIYQSLEGDQVKYQRNSGMLGVPGNIGLSTAFHAFHLEASVIEGTGCSVGDDALGGTRENPLNKLVPHIKLIGDLQEEK